MPNLPGRAVRPVRSQELDSFLALDNLAFLQTPDMSEQRRQLQLDQLELDRCIVAEADTPDQGSGGLAGIAAITSLDMRVPGAWLPVAGVTSVGVHPTQRRRAVLTAMMLHQLHDLHERSAEAVAVLWASEPMIYGRFGYGEATRFLTLTIPRTTSMVRTPPPDPTLRLRMVDPAEVDLVRGLYDAQAARRPGTPRLDDRGHRLRVTDAVEDREGFSALRCLVAEDDTGVRGFARFRVKGAWDTGVPRGVVRVRELHAGDAQARHALWQLLLDLDLTATVEVWLLPVDDPLLRWLPNPRVTNPALRDGLHARVVDVDRALAGRRYGGGPPGAGVDTVIEVRDALCPWNAGRWRLTGDATGAECGRARTEPELVMDVRELGALYLGGTSLVSLRDAGLVQERVEGAAARVGAGFAHDPAPFAPFVF